MNDDKSPTNGHDKTKEPPTERVVLCCVRLGNQSWCSLVDKHPEEHEGADPVYGPLEELPTLWRHKKGRI